MLRILFLFTLVLVVACGGQDACQCASGEPNPLDPVRQLVDAVEDNDMESMVDAFHPSLHGGVRRELASEPGDIPRIVPCLTRTLEQANPEPITSPSESM